LLSDSMIQSGRWISDRYGHNSKFVGLSIDLSNDGKPTIQRDDNGNVQLYSYDMLTRPGLWEIDLSFLLDGPSNLPVGMKERLFDAARYLQIALTHDDIDFESTESKAKNYVLTGNRQNLDRLMTSEAHFAYHNVLECARVHRNILQRKHETKEGGAHKGHYEDLAFEAFMRVYENAESIWNHAGVFDDLNTVARYFFGASDSFDSDLIKAAAQEADLTNQIPFSEY